MFLVKGQALLHARAIFRGGVRQAQRLFLKFYGLIEIARLGMSRRKRVDGSRVLPLPFGAGLLGESDRLLPVPDRVLGSGGIEPGDMI